MTQQYMLGDYDLKVGDFVKLARVRDFDREDWVECEVSDNNRGWTMRGRMNFYHGTPILAVLRPSVVIREKLDDILACIRDCTKFKTFPNPDVLTFDEIFPRKAKEEENNDDDLIETLKGLRDCDRALLRRIESLEKKLEEK